MTPTAEDAIHGAEDATPAEGDTIPEQGHTEEKAVFTFATTHHAMAAEDVLRGVPLRVEVVPPPRELTAGCGLALRIALQDVAAARAALSRERAPFAALHRLGPGQEVVERLT